MHVGFAFDVGTNSMGWCVMQYGQDNIPSALVDAGVRIFSDGREPKSGTSLAEGRRGARAMSRRRDRYKRRRKAVLRTLVEYGLMPSDPNARKALIAETNDRRGVHVTESEFADIYNLRKRAAEGPLTPFQTGRTLFHLNQRRGFKSNRKTDRLSNEKGAIELGKERLYVAMKANNSTTLGTFLAAQRGYDSKQWGQVRVRGEIPDAGASVEISRKLAYDFYPQREMLQDEFNLIWTVQASFDSAIFTEDRRAHLFRVMFFQRELKPQVPGKCSFNPDELRLPKTHPLFQTFRLYKEVNELELILPDLSRRKLAPEERDKLVRYLRGVRKGTYAKLRTVLKITGRAVRFNKETESRKDMAGDEVSSVMSDKAAYGNRWSGFSLDEQWQIVQRMRDEQDPLALHNWLVGTSSLSEDAAKLVAEIDLPSGYGRLGETAVAAMLAELIDGTADDDTGRQVVITEAEAARRAGYDHSLVREGDGSLYLPPYQEVLARRIPPGTGESDDPYDVRVGRITNPTVHIGLNQLRRVVNGLIERHGKPALITLELARDLNRSDDQKKKINQTIARNTRDAERRSSDLHNVFNCVDNGYNRNLLKLWERLNPSQVLNRECIYCGTVIAPSQIFSGGIEVDHIIPWSRSLDDSQANRILCHTACNRQKANYTPSEVPYWAADYDQILDRAKRLPENQQWRFARDAMAQFEKRRDFLDRQITDTQYLARLSHDYLGCLYDDEEPDGEGELIRRNHVVVVTGQMTEMLRRKWQLNGILSDRKFSETAKEKNRKDHRHHAIDAAVIGSMTRAMLKRISDAARLGEAIGAEDAVRVIDPPWPSFRDDLKAVIDRVVVSHKADHGTLPKAGARGQTAGQLHNDTAYGITGELDPRGNTIVVRRKPFLSLKETDIGSIRDEELRNRLHGATSGLKGKEFIAALMRFKTNDLTFKNIRHVRVTEPLTVIPIRDKEGRIYKGYKGDANFRYDVWELKDGSWVAEVVTMFDAHRPDWSSAIRAANPTARKVLSLKQNDMVAYDQPTLGATIGIVVKFGQSGQITLVPHKEAGDLKRRDALPQTEGDAAALMAGRMEDGRDQPLEFDPFKYYAPTAGGLKRIGLRQIRVDETGRVFDPGPQDKAARDARKNGAR